MFYEPHIDSFDLPCERLPAAFDGLSILHLSDLHITRWTNRLDLWEAALAQQKPDLLVVTGDLGHRSWLWKKSLAPITRLLHAVTPTIGTFFILGNHDSTKLAPALSQLNGFRYLANETVFLTRPPKPSAKGRKAASDTPRLALIGVHQHRRIDTDIPTAMRDVVPSDFKLMLLHYPDLIHQAVAAGADVALAGHTHGGQICWPDGSPIIRHDVLPQTMCTGVHMVNHTWMVVNRGIGVAGLRVRVFCPPQAILLTLRAAKVTVKADIKSAAGSP
jgi:predicted MPP superfamily phosphohydrolase